MKHFSIARIQGDASKYIPITATMRCSAWKILSSDSSNGFSIRTDTNDPATQIDYSAGVGDTFIIPLTLPEDLAGGYRFEVGCILFYAKLAGGTGTYILCQYA